MMASEKRPVTDQHRAVAQLAIRAFWLAHVQTVAEAAWRKGENLQLHSPKRHEIEAAAQVLADCEPETKLELAHAD